MNSKEIVFSMIDRFNYDREDHILVHSRYSDDLGAYEVTLLYKGKKDVFCTLYNESFDSAESKTYGLVLETLIDRAFLNYDRL